MVHVWLGQDGVSNVDLIEPICRKIEGFCNSAAAEFLVPGRQLKKYWTDAKKEIEPYQYLAHVFKVSPLVAARRCLDMDLIKFDSFSRFYDRYITNERRKQKTKAGGGDFWKTQSLRIGSRFGSAVVIAAKKGYLLYSEAYKLTGLNGLTFEKYASEIGLPLK